MLLYPEVATRDCEHCIQFMYDEKTGALQKDKAGNPIPRPKVRVWKGRTLAGGNPPCRQGRQGQQAGCPKGTPENQKALSPKNVRAYQHYLECKAVGSWPDDPIVRRNAATIARVETAIREAREEGHRKSMLAIFEALLKR